MLQTKKCKLCRREGKKLFLKGDRCNFGKCSFTRRSYAPGKSDKYSNLKLSDYNKQLRAKQTCKKIYKIREKMLKNYFIKAAKTKGSTGEKLLQLLELRLDNVVYKLGFAQSKSLAQQMISHGHILVNNNKTTIPSCQLKSKNKVSIKPNSQSIFKGLGNKTIKDVPIWLKLINKTSGEIIKIPEKNDITTDVDIQLIVEFYNR